ncbi:MAG: DUF4974 domain-containing protein [Prevotella sp.]|nr:DUF4974 domain-containing protein [Prevotella sp.]MBR6884519.1 DUF4974 domain-containing protein [Prevotella sp.]
MESNDNLEQLLRQMYAQESHHDEDIDTSDIIDEEWTKFEAEHFKDGRNSSSSILSFFHSTKKMAALFIGVLILSGITYAAIHMISSNPQSEQVDQTVAVDKAQPSTINTQQSASADSTIIQPVVFENAELGMILQEIASFYQCEVVYKKEKTKRVRLFFTWDKKQSLDQVVETFNKFERFHIAKENQKLIVE